MFNNHFTLRKEMRQQFTGEVDTGEVDTFMTSRYRVCAEHRVPTIIKIG